MREVGEWGEGGKSGGEGGKSGGEGGNLVLLCKWVGMGKRRAGNRRGKWCDQKKRRGRKDEIDKFFQTLT